jgi:hypothetical protein
MNLSEFLENLINSELVKSNKSTTIDIDNMSLSKYYKYFNYNNYELFLIDLRYLCEIYGIKLITTNVVRSKQDIFRDKIIKRDTVCIISGSDPIECQASHIVPFCISNSFDPNNGLLLNCCLHTTFDLGLWSINPNTLCVEVRPDILNSNPESNIMCKLYNGKKINLQPNNVILTNIKHHYDNYKKFQTKC